MSEYRSAKGAAQEILSIGSIMRLEQAGLSVVFTARMTEMIQENNRMAEQLQMIREVLDKGGNDASCN